MAEENAWVTDPDALRTIIRMNAVQVGDMLLGRHPDIGERTAFVREDTLWCMPNFDNDSLTDRSRWRLVGWKRSSKEKRRG